MTKSTTTTITEADREAIFQLAAKVRKMEIILNADKAPLGGKKYHIEQLIIKAAALCPQVMASIGYVEIKDKPEVKA